LPVLYGKPFVLFHSLLNQLTDFHRMFLSLESTLVIYFLVFYT
jgi:hypothetical protein